MEITERAETRGLRRYRVLRKFQATFGKTEDGKPVKHPRIVEPDEEISLSPEEEKDWGYGEVQLGRLEPILPDIVQCRALKPIKAVVGEEAVEVERGALVELKAPDALKRILAREVIPTSPDIWCPFKIKRRVVPDAVLRHALKGGVEGFFAGPYKE